MNSEQPLDRFNQFAFHWEHIFTALFLSGFTAFIAYALASLKPQRYSQLIAGSIAWSLGSKQPDYILLSCFVISFFLIYGGLYALASCVLKRNGAAAERSLRQLLIYSLLPFGILLGRVIVSTDRNAIETVTEILVLSLLFVLLTIGFCVTIAVKRVENLSTEDYLNWVGGSLLYLVFALLVGSALTLFVGRINLDWQLKKSGQVAIVSGIGFALFSLPLVKVWWQLSAKSTAFCSQLRFLLWAVQGFFPLFFFILLPTPWSAKGDKYYGQPITVALLVLVSGLVVATYMDWFLRFKKSAHTPDASSVFSVVSPLGLIALLLFIKSGTIEASVVPIDDYHWGELLLPWWLSQTFHYIPFWDYEPSRGLVNYVFGCLANLFFGTVTATSVTFGSTLTGIYFNPLLSLLYLGFGFLAISRTIGILPTFLALLLMTNSNGLFEIDLITTACLCLWGNLFLKQQWTRWLAVWAIAGVMLLLFAPGQAGLLLLATSPLGAFALFQAIRKERRSLISLMGVGSFLLGLLLWLTPLGKMLFGALRYAVEQSSINSLSYGVSWRDSYGTNPVLSYSLWEVMRTSWILVGLVAGLLLFRAIVDKTWAVRGRYAVFAIPIVLLTVLFIPRAAGRIDPGGLSRLGTASVWSICLLLPIVLITALEPHRKALSLMVVAVLGGMLVGLPSTEPLMSKPVRAIYVSSQTLMNKVKVGFPKLGEAVTIYPKQLARLQQIKRVLQVALNPGETYLDLTNHSADYFYLGYPPPIQAGAVHNLPHQNQQRRAIARLDAAPPPIALLAADNILHDGGTLPLRAHLLYRYAVANYIPVKIEGLIYGVRPDQLERLQPLLTMSTSRVGKVPAVQLALLDQALLTSDLKKILRSWGQSIDSLTSELKPVQQISDGAVPVMHSVEKVGKTYRITGRDPHIDFDVSGLNLNGQDAGILTFDFSSNRRSTPPNLEVYWSSKSGGNLSEETVIRFSAVQGKIIVPLDAAPRWLLAEGIKTIRFDVADPAPCSTFSLSHIELFQRTEMPKGLKN